MNSSLPDNIDELKRLLAEQEALNRALLEKLADREREIDHLQAQLDKLRRMNFGSRSEKVSRRIAQMEEALQDSTSEEYARLISVYSRILNDVEDTLFTGTREAFMAKFGAYTADKTMLTDPELWEIPVV